MIVVMKAGAAKANVDGVIAEIQRLGYRSHPIYGVERTVIGCIGDERGKTRLQALESMPGVEACVPILKPFKLASREVKKENSIVEIGLGVTIGAGRLAVMAGPCSVESEQQIMESARSVKAAGANILRGGAYKPRTSPYSFQGMEADGLKLLAKARAETGLPVVTEVLDPHDVELVADHADVLQVGARNVQNFALLKRLGKIDKPVLLKRGMMSTLQEFLMAAEYILSEGNPRVVLCERGIRTFETATRNTLDLNAVPVLKEWTHLPVIVDPSHAAGRADLVPALAAAAVAVGADGLIVEVHHDPDRAMSDGIQSLYPEQFDELMKQVRQIAPVVGRMVPAIGTHARTSETLPAQAGVPTVVSPLA
jgi:3-deoxy-7-phosphoheptulonate synthase